MTVIAQPIPEKKLGALKRAVFKSPHSFTPGAQYHDARHTGIVISNVLKLASILELPKRQTQILVIAALFHDYQHSGTPYRNLKSAQKLSNEEHAVKQALRILDDFDPSMGITHEEKKEIAELIKNTSFGQKPHALGKLLRRTIPGTNLEAVEARTEEFEKLNRSYEPKTQNELLLCLADVGAFLVSPEMALKFGARHCQETGRSPCVDKFIHEQRVFLSGHILPLKELFIKKIPPEKHNQMCLLLNRKIGAYNRFLNNEGSRSKIEDILKAA